MDFDYQLQTVQTSSNSSGASKWHNEAAKVLATGLSNGTPNSNSTQQCVRYQATRQQSKTVKIALFGLFLSSNASDFDKYHCNEPICVIIC